LNTDQRESLRREYLPRDVRVLFVGESPPAAGTFFYAANSVLYRATRDAFGCGDDFLGTFARLGCYLEDLCHEPVNRLPLSERGAARRTGEPQLTRVIAELRPRIIVVLLRAIEGNVARAAAAAGCANAERYVVTYPSRWHHHRIAYRRELSALMRTFAERGIFL
jgi:hypothetical protein